MKKIDPKHFVVALFFALIAGGSTAWISANQDLLFEWSWQKTDGAFQQGLDPLLLESLTKQVNLKFKEEGQICQVRYAGKDRSSAYFAYGCAKFYSREGEIFAEGDENFIPAKARIKNNEVINITKANVNALENSMKRIFPREVAHAARLLMDRDTYMGQGMKLQQETASQAEQQTQ